MVDLSKIKHLGKGHLLHILETHIWIADVEVVYEEKFIKWRKRSDWFSLEQY